MFRKFYLLCFSFTLVAGTVLAQSGTLKGVITDKATGEAIPFANIVVERNGSQSGGGSTNFDGEYTIKPLDPGNYTIKASFIGYTQVEVTGVIVSSNKITFQNISMSEGIDIDEVEVISFKKPLLDQDNLAGKTVTADEIKEMPTRSVSSVAATTAGVYKQDENSAINVRGSRADATDYYVDGMKVRGSLGVPQGGIEQITVITGGVPAQYGDATGGIISVTTKGPSQKFFGGVEYVTSKLFDKYDYNLVGLALSGPIWKKIEDDGSKGRSILGYFISAEATDVADRDPSAIGMWKLKDDRQAWLQENPFRLASISESGSLGLLSNADFLRNPTDGDGNPTDDSDFELIQNKLNNGQRALNVSGKIDFKPTMNLNLTLGGQYSFDERDYFLMRNSLMAWDNMPKQTIQNWRVFGRLTQKFGAQEEDDKESASTIKNAYYTIQADYNEYKAEFNPLKDESLFRLGYVGKFKTSKAPFLLDSLVNGDPQMAQYEQVAFYDTLFTFTPNGGDASLEAYTQSYFDLYEENIGTIRNQYALQGLGLLNGQYPDMTYSLWANPGGYSGYTEGWTSKSKATQFGVKMHAAADIGNHEISFGFEYEQRKDSYWGMTGAGSWQLMRGLANKHISELDLANPIYRYVSNNSDSILDSYIDPFVGIAGYTYQDTIFYDRLSVGYEDSHFGQALRQHLQSLGYDNVGEYDWIDIDSYDPETFSLEFFSPDELLNEGNSYNSYYGFDARGNEIKTNPTLEDFFTQFDNTAFGDSIYSRLIPAFQPTYIAGYIQDKFAFDDLIFNIGVRVDRYDANQPVLKDPYLLHDAYTVGEISTINGANIIHPESIGDDFVIYVDKIENAEPTAITGYRSGNDWYDANGVEVDDPAIITQLSNGNIVPYLKDNTPDRDERYLAFEDYSPELIFMPRISFSFPISDEAQFFAHYDVLTQRPPGANRLDPTDYFYLDNSVGALINNPNLKSEKTIDYELGFAQTLSKRSALTISAFYKELRDMIQVAQVNYAYPVDYMTYQNLDFGTVKGFSASYDLRRTGNVSLTANYTLQFADGTGSSATDGYNLVNTGMPNLRTLIPLNYDQRHALTATINYSFDSGKDYNGPMWFGKRIFENFGANLILTSGSGTPFSKQGNITQEAASGINDRSVLEGSINGSRLPWSFRVSSRISKRFVIKWDKKDGGKKQINLSAYVQVQNLLNTANIISVYRATGNPDDDGYLSNQAAEAEIDSKNDPTSFEDLYRMRVNAPGNYSMPRMARLGLTIDF